MYLPATCSQTYSWAKIAVINDKLKVISKNMKIKSLVNLFTDSPFFGKH
jgi:hypothetical protein